jgi:Bifunctional DNA primase/polymerase, N-terminal
MAAQDDAEQDALTPEIRAAAVRGWRLLPIQAHVKTSLMQEWPKAVTSAPDGLEAWVAQLLRRNSKMSTEEVPGVMAIGVDGVGGRATVADLERRQ